LEVPRGVAGVFGPEVEVRPRFVTSKARREGARKRVARDSPHRENNGVYRSVDEIRRGSYGFARPIRSVETEVRDPSELSELLGSYTLEQIDEVVAELQDLYVFPKRSDLVEIREPSVSDAAGLDFRAPLG
jgi:hypothetical protein